MGLWLVFWPCFLPLAGQERSSESIQLPPTKQQLPPAQPFADIQLKKPHRVRSMGILSAIRARSRANWSPLPTMPRIKKAVTFPEAELHSEIQRQFDRYPVVLLPG